MATNNAASTAVQAPQKSGFIPLVPVPVGGVVLASTPIDYNENRKTIKLKVCNTGDRPIQVGSHFHFFEVNRYLEFDRTKAFGCHLNIPATTAIRFEPGDSKEVEVVSFAGKRRVIGFNGIVNGYTGCENDPSYFPVRIRAFRRIKKLGFKCIGDACNCEPCECDPCECNDKKETTSATTPPKK